MVEDELVAEVDGAMVQGGAVEADEEEVAWSESFVFGEFAEAGGGPGGVEGWVFEEVGRGSRPIPVAEVNALLGVPVAGQGPAVLDGPDPLTPDEGWDVATGK